jgi:hypothetical protein
MVEGVSSRMIYLIYCKNFCECHSVTPPSTTIKKNRRGMYIKSEKTKERKKKLDK